MFHCVVEQEGISPLSVASDCGGECLQTGRKVMIQGPEFVARMTGCFGQYLKGAHGTHGTLGNVGVRQQTEHAELGQRIGSPAAVPGLGKPTVRRGMAIMAGPNEREKNIDVQQMPVHPSSKNARTCFAVISGKSSDASSTGRPFFVEVLSW